MPCPERGIRCFAEQDKGMTGLPICRPRGNKGVLEPAANATDKSGNRLGS